MATNTDHENGVLAPRSSTLDRRAFFLGAVSLLTVSGQARAQGKKRTFVLEERFLPQMVAAAYDYPAGTIVVVPRARYLYLVAGAGFARRYGIGVGKAGLAFSGSAVIGRKAKWPPWRPTNNMIRRDPKKYARYADGVPVTYVHLSQRVFCVHLCFY